MRRVFDVHHQVAMARIPLRPATPTDSRGPETDGILAEGIFLASRSAADATDTPRGQATQRAYDLRSRTRTTPHGVFAAVAPATIGTPTPTMRLGSAHRAVTTPNPAWLAAISEQLLESEPDLLHALTLTSATLATLRGDRWEIEHPTPDGAQRSSVRATQVATWVLETARHGVQAGDLIEQLLRRHPGASAERAAGAVRDMISSGLLLTDLLPAGLNTDPLHHLLDKLPPQTAIRAELESLAKLLTDADAYPPGAPPRRELLAEATQLADTLHPTRRPLAVDTLAEADIALPTAVGDKASEAASLLWRIGHRAGPLADYHQRFCATYGHHRLVPLLEALDPVVGLGPPKPEDGLGTEEDPGGKRTAVFGRLLAEALTGGANEVALTDGDIDQLANPSPLPPPRTAEIHLQLAHTANGLAVAVCPATGSQVAGAAAGRFTQHVPALTPFEAPDSGSGVMLAEVVFRSRTARAGALAAETGAAPWRIPLDVPAQAGDLLSRDLAIGTTGTHLQLWSTRHERPVIPMLCTRLAPRLLPPAAHLLHLLGHSGTRPWHPWNWGPFTDFPYTPRVRYRDIQLAPARWRLPDDVTAAANRRTAFDTHIAEWRTATRPAPPPVVVVEEADRRLPLDLDDSEQREILRRSIHRGTRAVAEPFANPKELACVQGPTGQHMIDLVVPLTRHHTTPDPAPDLRRALRRRPTAAIHPPGSNWLSAALSAPAYLHDVVLANLRALLDALPGSVDRWFYLRYTTEALGPHLRLRFHADPHTLATAIQPQLATLAERLRRSGLLRSLHLEPYEQEIERYGGPTAIDAAETVFTADSRLALGATELTADERLLLAAACTTYIARTLAPNQPRTALRPGRLTADQRRHRDILRPHLTHGTAALVPTHLATAHADLRTALEAYRDTLHPDTAARCAGDVIHMHSNRNLGTGPEGERLARTLAADLLHH